MFGHHDQNWLHLAEVLVVSLYLYTQQSNLFSPSVEFGSLPKPVEKEPKRNVFSHRQANHFPVTSLIMDSRHDQLLMVFQIH